MSKHTPGPWTFDRATGKFGHKTNDIVAPYHGPDFRHQVVCVMGTEAETEDGADAMEANASLIAAAPDLLEALKEANKILETARKYFPSSIQNSDRFSLENVIQNSVGPAIAKAEGRE